MLDRLPSSSFQPPRAALHYVADGGGRNTEFARELCLPAGLPSTRSATNVVHVTPGQPRAGLPLASEIRAIASAVEGVLGWRGPGQVRPVPARWRVARAMRGVHPGMRHRPVKRRAREHVDQLVATEQLHAAVPTAGRIRPDLAAGRGGGQVRHEVRKRLPDGRPPGQGVTVFHEPAVMPLAVAKRAVRTVAPLYCTDVGQGADTLGHVGPLTQVRPGPRVFEHRSAHLSYAGGGIR